MGSGLSVNLGPADVLIKDWELASQGQIQDIRKGGLYICIYKNGCSLLYTKTGGGGGICAYGYIENWHRVGCLLYALR